MKTLLRLIARLFFRYRAFNEGVLATPGPVLLVPNHLSWLDWLFVGVCLDDDWKFVTSSTTAQTSWLHRKIMVNSMTFPIDPSSPYAARRMAEFLQKGGRLVLFAEGRLSHTGTLMKLFDGTGFLLHKTHAKVITAYLRGASRLPYSPNPGWKKFFTPVTAHFSEVHTPPNLDHLGTGQARSTFTTWLRDRMVRQQFDAEMEFGASTLPAAITDIARQQPKRVVLEDATLQTLTYRKLRIAARVLATEFEKAVPHEKSRHHVGVLLPNINATPVLLLALWKLGKVPAILNFSTGNAIMVACAQLAGLKQILTSRLFLERAKLSAEPFIDGGIDVIFLEDLKASITPADKFRATLQVLFGGAISGPLSADSAAVILFTSGSEGVPKGVELTHRNILANVRQMLATTDITDHDRVFNCLPLFHSFGLTVGLLLPLVRGLYTFIYPSPLHYRMVPVAFYDRDCTMLLSTNTFLNGYARKAHPYDFRSLRYLFAAAEKLQEATAATWSQRFGVRVLEGYGATECAPCVSVNTPLEPRYGTVGRLMPGMEYRLEKVDGVADGGRLFVRGPNVMKGYLNPDANAKFQALGGWYDTGDIVSISPDGYLEIRGRMKRFAKVSGEMVSLTAVEDALAGAFPHYGLRCQTAIVTRPDEDKGEALICCTNESRLTQSEIREAIKAKGLSNLCVPREIIVVREIPKLGTGKVNHRELQAMVNAGTAAQKVS
jgi:acyl-[acyl-carrier-protein]-phospholipid O-acyltransferase/long-chain-fatty-acid--[acyl-carrier-protein] ligase